MVATFPSFHTCSVAPLNFQGTGHFQLSMILQGPNATNAEVEDHVRIWAMNNDSYSNNEK